MEKRFRRLRGKITEQYGTIGAFAAETGLSRTSVTMKLSGKVAISAKDMINWSNLLGIDHADIPSYFFE